MSILKFYMHVLVVLYAALTRGGRVPCMNVMWGGRRMAGRWVALAVRPLAKSCEMEQAATYAVTPTSFRGSICEGTCARNPKNHPWLISYDVCLWHGTRV